MHKDNKLGNRTIDATSNEGSLNTSLQLFQDQFRRNDMSAGYLRNTQQQATKPTNDFCACPTLAKCLQCNESGHQRLTSALIDDLSTLYKRT